MPTDQTNQAMREDQLESDRLYVPPAEDEDRIFATDQSISYRIHHITTRYLEELGQRNDTWQSLFVDPKGWLWVLEYPHSERHGGGPKLLRKITKQEAIEIFEPAGFNGVSFKPVVQKASKWSLLKRRFGFR